MEKFSEFLCKKKVFILVVASILLLLSFVGMIKTKINYDILIYLPEDIETMKGQKILTNDFDMGSFATVITYDMSHKDMLKLESEIKEIDTVEKVVSLADVTGTTIPLEFLPKDVLSKVKQGDKELMLVTFKEGISHTKTLNAVRDIRKLGKKHVKVGGMSSMVLDTMDISDSEFAIYIVISVILCIVILSLALDSYAVPFILLTNIGVAIGYNMGTNYFLGEISYITKAISSVLQLGVTTDFSIFLYHKYEAAKKKYKNNNDAMKSAIKETAVSVIGSSLTTIAGFLALCTMNLSLGKDIGIVMAKGVLLGVVSVITIFPALLLVFDNIITKTSHKPILPKFTKLNNFVIKHYKVMFALFLILIIPAWFGQKNTKSYYNLDKSLPRYLESSVAGKTLKEEFGVVSPEIILIDSNIKNSEVEKMVVELENVKGIDTVLSPSKLESIGLTDEILGDELTSVYKTDKYKMIMINSKYETATDLLNSQIDKVNKIIKKYDKTAILAGEGPLMKDLVVISDEDFHNVNYSSLGVIFIIMIFVLKSITLPILLICLIEFAIFINMGIPYYTGLTIPFIASIVIGTIQLGATIDYTILLTTKFIEERKKGIDKLTAIKTAVEVSSTSIFVSGMCFFAATFGVGIISKLDMISTLCTLISRGAIISMIVVIGLLPSFLIIFDKLICKSTLGFRKEESNMNKRKKIAVLLIIGIIINITNVNALTKNETVFAKLDYNGKSKNITVNEHLTNINDEENIEDVTTLKEILNINGNEKFNLNGNKITFENKGNEIYYSGKSDKKLPINMNIKYKLDGRDIELKKLLGKSGHVTISIDYTNNLKQNVVVNNVNKTLYTPFVVTTGTIIPTKNIKNVTVTNGKVSSTGDKYIILALASPGLSDSLESHELDKLNNITIEYDVKKFKLNSIYTVATSKLLDDSDLDIFDRLDKVYENAEELNNASKKLVDGSKSLAAGTAKAYNGSSLLSNTLNEKLTEQKSKQAIDDNTLNYLVSVVKNTVSNSFTDEKINEIGSSAEAKVNESINYYQNVVASKANDAEFQSMIATCTTETPHPLCATEDVQNYMQAAYIATNPNVQNLMRQTAKTTAIETAKKTAEEVSTTVALLVATKVAEQAKTETIASLETLQTNINLLTNGLKELNDGANLLSSGIVEFDSIGIDKVTTLITKDLKTKVKTVEKLKELSNNYNTYTMKNDSDSGETKFIMVVDGKEKKINKNTKKK